MAERYLRRERPGHTLQPTAVVNEAYLRLIGRQGVDWQDRAHFFAVAAQSMRRILVEHARHRDAKKRGGQGTRYLLDTVVITEPRAVDLIAVDDALAKLTALDSEQGRVVELRFFGGLTEEETAEVLSVSSRTDQAEMARGQDILVPRAFQLLPMTPDRWRRAQEVFVAATEREPGSRATFLEEACRGDPELQTEVESLLSSFEAAPSGFLESPAIDGVTGLSPNRADSRPLGKGMRLGPYEILAPLGAGGMGEVYRAQRPASRARGGDQGAAGGVVGRSGAPEAFREGSAFGLVSQPPQHRHDLRHRILGGRGVDRDGAGGRQTLRELAQRASRDQEAACRSRRRSPTAWPRRTRPGSCIGT